ncbi:MAG: response regulator transcription factor [Flavobacteriaceae bacterium]|nr:response regulator transcription factor [Flavobacteriaceae bacterium]
MQTTTSIKLFLIDDSEIHLAGLKWLLSQNPSVEVLGMATQPAEVLKSAILPHAEVILLDISLESESDGIELMPSIFTLNPAVKIIMLSHNKDVPSIVKSIQNGASAYLAKDSSMEEILAVIELAVKGNGFFMGETLPKSVLANCFSNNHDLAHPKPWNLSERELEIIQLLAKGYISKEIADRLHINTTTVESHKENIKQKLQCKSIVEVVVFALKNGLIH